MIPELDSLLWKIDYKDIYIQDKFVRKKILQLLYQKIILNILFQDASLSTEDDSDCAIRNRMVGGSRNSQVSLSSNAESDFRSVKIYNFLPRQLSQRSSLKISVCLFCITAKKCRTNYLV